MQPFVGRGELEESPEYAKRPWHVKYDGTCTRCGLTLRKGDVAVYDRCSNTIRCVECPSSSGTAIGWTPDLGVAGQSARHEYDRRSSRRESRIRGRFGDRVGRVVLALTTEAQSTRSWQLGAIGEEMLAAAFAGLPNVRVLHDRRVNGTKRNIDHLFVCPAGVFVVDAKNYRGTIRIRDRGGLFRTDHRLYVGRRDCSNLANAMAWQVEATKAALVVAGIDPLPSVTPVLCFVDGEWPLLFPPSEYKGVRLEGLKSLRKLLTASGNLDDVAIAAVHRALAAALPPK